MKLQIGSKEYFIHFKAYIISKLKFPKVKSDFWKKKRKIIIKIFFFFLDQLSSEIETKKEKGLFSLLWEAARYCILTRLKTPFGGSTQVFLFFFPSSQFLSFFFVFNNNNNIIKHLDFRSNWKGIENLYSKLWFILKGKSNTLFTFHWLTWKTGFFSFFSFFFFHFSFLYELFIHSFL